MYLAPLNYDRFFKKVFSDIEVSKMFLEDFLEEEIEEIEQLDKKHRVTDDANVVEFDYRCKIRGNYIIIDMQQWYKPDISQRFYVYHALNSALQLDGMKKKGILITTEDGDSEKVKEVKDYRRIEPVMTLIWMVDDNLGYKENYVSYALTPHMLEEFIQNMKLWKNADIAEIQKERKRLLEVLANRSRGIDFLNKNKLIFMFQKNIVKSDKLEKYVDWFNFAEKTRNSENKKQDFEEYMNDKRFKEPIRRLCKEILSEDDIKYINEESEIWTKVQRYENGIREDSREQGREEGKEEGRKEEKIEIARNLLRKNIPFDIVAESTGLTVEEIEGLKD